MLADAWIPVAKAGHNFENAAFRLAQGPAASRKAKRKGWEGASTGGGGDMRTAQSGILQTSAVCRILEAGLKPAISSLGGRRLIH